MGGHSFSAQTVYIDWYYGYYYGQPEPVTVLNRGPITATNVYAAQAFDLIPSDHVANFTLSGGTSTIASSVSTLSLSASSQAITAGAGNVTGSVSLDTSSTLTVVAPLRLNGNLDIENYSTLNMAGQPLSAPTITLGSDGEPASLQNSGAVAANYLSIEGGSAVTLPAFGSAIGSQIYLAGNSSLTLQQANGQLTGLTLNGQNAGALSVTGTSVLQLTAGTSNGPSWIFRWQDPGNGTWVSTLAGLIASGSITVTAPAGYSVFDDEGYTYVAAPTTLVWNGSGGNTSWSNSANWGGTNPTPGQWLRFGALAPGGHASNTNDILGNPLFYGIFFDSLAPSYDLRGNGIELCGDVLNQSANNQKISLDVELVPGNGAFDTDAVTFDTGGQTMSVDGSISGAGMALVKDGNGTLILSGTNTYDGGTIVTAGDLIFASSAALVPGSSLTVGAEAELSSGPLAVVAWTNADAATPNAVPEPSGLALAAAALGGAVAYQRLRSRRRRAV